MKSQGPSTTSKASTRANLHFYWLVLTAIAWGAPIIISLYLPLALIEKLIGRKTKLGKYIYNFRKKLFANGIYAYLCMQKFFKPHYDLKELRTLEEKNERFLIVSNHRSHLDVFLFIAQIKGLQLLAKKSLFKVPLLNIMMILTRQIPAEKGDWKSLEAATLILQQRIRAGEKVLIFPEFKRCEAGLLGTNAYSLLPFRLAIQEKIKILPLVVYGTDQVWPKGSLKLKTQNVRQNVVALQVIDSQNYQSAKELRDKIQALSQDKYVELSREL
ncbi:MAG: 1-acyl-sn-glycerol-3-phosphate acyltransferase [Bdellovibrionota bacterium]